MKTKIHYAWIILLLAFFGLLATQGARLAFGAFIEPWQHDFAADRGSISFISTISFIVYGLSQPLFGRLIEKVGVRRIFSFSVLLVGISFFLTKFVTSTWQLYILYGILASVGVGGASGVAASVAVTTWFHKKRGLAFGIIEAGFGAGQMIMVPASLYLIEGLGWRTAVVLLGLFLSCIVFPILLIFMRSTPADIRLRPLGEEGQNGEVHSNRTEKATNLPLLSLLFMKPFWGLVIPFFICGMTTTGLMDTHLVPFCYDQGFSTDMTGMAVGVLAAFNIVGSLFSGQLADRWDNRFMLVALYMLRSVSILILLLSHQSFWLLVFSVIFGLVDFATSVPTQLLAAKYFKNHSVGLILGLLSMGHQIGSAVGAYLPGMLYTRSGNYHLTFIIAILLLILGSLFTLLLPKQYNTISEKIMEPVNTETSVS
ncbi:MFS transporter [Aneurinibacillus sp. Ricciae_BoGa-3]|uniref:MFS transporter n=1 Tax=Aneurinibacillus sp. Ricciae_BoGa-3 TaxID=3022697 RepID=UPI00234050C0|nr:MFS transporter [Aneurinibacillus sp. Ricciae_BoGa-3]WCK54912.1 MFS transporter [Aneurinibacillus sp. Ricciae_BoGa-3]